jgi:hypothetical protein
VEIARGSAREERHVVIRLNGDKAEQPQRDISTWMKSPKSVVCRNSSLNRRVGQ